MYIKIKKQRKFYLIMEIRFPVYMINTETMLCPLMAFGQPRQSWWRLFSSVLMFRPTVDWIMWMVWSIISLCATSFFSFAAMKLVDTDRIGTCKWKVILYPLLESCAVGFNHWHVVCCSQRVGGGDRELWSHDGAAHGGQHTGCGGGRGHGKGITETPWVWGQ